tara:strand:- start:87 stop:275 length:189 start_codon:yes stop_codon:yes gene_type:complete
MAKGFDVKLEGIDIDPDEIQKLLKKYKKVKKYQKSSLFAVKTMDGTEGYVSQLIRESKDTQL